MLLTESSSAEPSSPTAYLKQGDAFLMADSYDDAIAAYEKGIALLSQDESLAVALSLETNLGTAFYSSDRLDDAAASYQGALTNYQSHLSTDKRMLHEDDLKSIAASAAFYLGMVYQDIGEGLDAVEAYQLAISLDPLHWSALANLGSVFQDILVNYDRALQAYNQAYLILANAEEAAPPTDMPKEPRFILSQLQYRIGKPQESRAIRCRKGRVASSHGQA
jgi:tetratricopeptide (TPR) repeat protein